ncbi:MAG: hypothetical protein R2826_03550 [Thermoleophilia bacterium]
MNNFDILKDYSKGDLRRLAKGKISEIVGLDADKILRDLSRVLGNYESVKRNIEFRTPPTDTILEVLLDAEDHRIRTDDLKASVKRRIHDYVEASASLDLKNAKKNYSLYAKMLEAAWEFEDDLKESEANLLRVLRSELGITRTEHQMIMAHAEIGRLKFVASEYEDGLAFLTNEGIVLVCCADGESYFTLSDETSDSLLQLWGFDMRLKQRQRLFESLTKNQLVIALKDAGLKTAGSSAELVARLIENEIATRTVLSALGTVELVGLLAKLGLPKSGNKEDRVYRIVDHFRSDADIAVTEVAPPVEEVAPETESLGDEAVVDLLDELGIFQLGDALQALGLPKTGSKAAKIARLAESRFNSHSVLATLSKGELVALAGKMGLNRTANKPELIESIICHVAEADAQPSELTAKDLLEVYDELSRQDTHAYPPQVVSDGMSASRMGLDFERATRYIFKNLLRLDTKTQKAGREEPDGVLVDESGAFFCYECKTTLWPPYTLPIQHRLQVRNYISTLAKSRRAEQFAGYLIIAHSFADGIEVKLAAIESPLDVPLAVIEARDLLAFARKWQDERPIDTYPIGAVLHAGRVTARDLQRAGRA